MKVLAVDIDGTYTRYACMKELYASCPFPIPEAEIVSSKFRHDANLIGALQCYLADQL